jgi:hypothetical protein
MGMPSFPMRQPMVESLCRLDIGPAMDIAAPLILPLINILPMAPSQVVPTCVQTFTGTGSALPTVSMPLWWPISKASWFSTPKSSPKMTNAYSKCGFSATAPCSKMRTVFFVSRRRIQAEIEIAPGAFSFADVGTTQVSSMPSRSSALPDTPGENLAPLPSAASLLLPDESAVRSPPVSSNFQYATNPDFSDTPLVTVIFTGAEVAIPDFKKALAVTVY